jgi:hypothetical protein
MGDLDAERDRRDLADRLDDTGERPLRRVVIEPEIAGGDPPLRRDGGRLQNEQPGAGKRERAEMDHVPVAGLSVLRGILAHRRDDDAIGDREAAEGEGFKEMGHLAFLKASESPARASGG